jgi:peptide/nickel transport system ATP-binding protein
VPYPDPARKLDFAKLEEGRASEPEAWPVPFTINIDAQPTLIDVGEGHYVRAHKGADFRELVA